MYLYGNYLLWKLKKVIHIKKYGKLDKNELYTKLYTLSTWIDEKKACLHKKE